VQTKGGICDTIIEATVLSRLLKRRLNMNQQMGKTAALYYRVASTQTENLYLDNQMHTLLCYRTGMSALYLSSTKGGGKA